jgi:hypothetical protein
MYKRRRRAIDRRGRIRDVATTAPVDRLAAEGRVNIGLSWDQSQLDAFVGTLPKKLAYATINAIADTAKEIQQAEFQRARSIFTIRNQSFFFGNGGRVGGVAARITHFPKLTDPTPFADIEAGTLPSGSDELSSNRRLLYSRFEDGGTRLPFTPGAKSVAVPITGGPARPSADSPIDPAFTFAKLQLRAFYRGTKLTRQTRSRKNLPVGIIGEYGRVGIPTGTPGVQWKGKNRTFILFTAEHPQGAVFERTGAGAIRMVWSFVPPFAIDKRLEFVSLAQSVAQRFFAEACERQVQDALTHDVLKAVALA